VQPLVSIIIPYYNRPAYVKRAINSVLNQSYLNWELILIDDCSYENLNEEDIADYSKNKKIKLLRNEINQGPGLSRQVGIDISTGSFICFLDSDDIYEPTFLASMIDVHLANPDVAGVYCITKNTSNQNIRQSDIETNQILPTLFIHNRPWSTASWMWKKTEIAFWKGLRTNEDWLFEIDTAKINNKIAHLKEALCTIDDLTGQNTKDLVDIRSPELHRNAVAVYALDSIDSYSDLYNYAEIRKSIVRRLIFTSSKLIGLNEHKLVYSNGNRLSLHETKISIILKLSAICCCIIPQSSSFLKKALLRLHFSV
jgi:glycosyltransferase involved in cell wall biosynthesis